MRPLSLLFLLAHSALLMGQPTPNIVLIVADDLGYGDIGAYDNKSIATPHIDKLAAGGARFTQAYAAAPVCTPSRTGFITGRYPARTPVGLREPLGWIRADSAVGLSPETPSLAAMLKAAGYTTHLCGKWHLGFQQQYSPLANGFDSFFGFHGGGLDYVSHTDPRGNNDLYENKRQVTREGYMTHLLADDAIRYLRQPRTRPFFLSIQFNAPHWPWQAAGDSAYPNGVEKWHEAGSAKKFAGMVQSLDSAIGRILQTLQEQNLGDNTLVIFTSDNGGEQYSDMAGLKERKMLLWEGGIRVPTIAWWPSKIKSGSTITQPVTQLDFTATFLALAKARPSPQYPLDGMDISAWLFKPGTQNIDRTFFWRVFQRHQQQAVRQGNWKYLKTENETYLFDLATDPFENNNLKEKHHHRFQELQALFAQWEKTVLAPVPLPPRTPS